jgi:hypothetical protein
VACLSARLTTPRADLERLAVADLVTIAAGLIEAGHA